MRERHAAILWSHANPLARDTHPRPHRLRCAGLARRAGGRLRRRGRDHAGQRPHASGCAPTDAPELTLVVGPSGCPLTLVSGFRFVITGADLVGLHAGSTLTVVGDPNGATTGGHSTPVGMGAAYAPLTGGTLIFTTLVPGVSATGTYDVTFAGGSASGSFSADACPGQGPCG